MTWTIRPFVASDQQALDACDFTFTTQRVLSLHKSVRGLATAWQLSERDLEGQYTGNYGLSAAEWDMVRQRGETQPALLLVAAADAATAAANAPVALLDVAFEDWNETARIWNIYIDAKQRGHGLGRQLIEQAVTWARAPERKARALVAETQTNNFAACQFYLACGFELAGIDDHFYSNNDREAKMGIGEVALFWYKAL